MGNVVKSEAGIKQPSALKGPPREEEKKLIGILIGVPPVSLTITVVDPETGVVTWLTVLHTSRFIVVNKHIWSS